MMDYIFNPFYGLEDIMETLGAAPFTVQTEPLTIKFVDPPVIVPAVDAQTIDHTWDMIVLAAQSSK